MSHAFYSASGSAMWFGCPRSLKEQKKYPYEPASRYADEGTACHTLMERCFKNKEKPEKYLGTEIATKNHTFEVDDEMVESVNAIIDYVKGITTTPLNQRLAGYEIKVHYDDIAPKGYGTADVVVYDTITKTIHIVDLKYGKGIVVDAKENSQMLLYAWGSYRHLVNKHNVDDVVNVSVHIVQPRANNFSRYDLTLDELKAFAEYAKERVADTLKPDPPMIAGKHCQWCKHKPNCQAHADMVQDKAKLNFKEVPAVNVATTVSDEDKRALLENLDAIKALASAYEDDITKRLQAGKDVKGFKLVMSNKQSTWNDDAEAKLKEVFGDDIYKSSLKSVADIKKLADADGKKFIDAQRHKPKGMPVFAFEDDKRPAITAKDLGFKKS